MFTRRAKAYSSSGLVV